MVYNVIFIVFILCFCSPVFAQNDEPQAKPSADASGGTLTKSIEEAIKNAIKNVETENAKKHEYAAQELSVKLVSAINDWFSKVKGERTKELNKLQHHDWSELQKFPSPLPYDYYLKNFTYTIKKNDITLTDSVVNPYKAFVEIAERLYLEGYHSTDAAYPEQYRYTVFTPIALQLEYRDGMFSIVESKYGQPVMERGWTK